MNRIFDNVGRGLSFGHIYEHSSACRMLNMFLLLGCEGQSISLPWFQFQPN
jgi:hypothetical protein